MENEAKNIVVLKKTLELSEIRYKEEVDREKSIISQANFFLAAIALIITSVITVLIALYKSNYKNAELALIFCIIILVLLFLSLSLALISTWRYKRHIFPDANDIVERLNEYCDDEFNMTLSIVLTYDTIIQSLHKLNNKKIKKLLLSHILLCVVIICIIIFSIFLVVNK